MADASLARELTARFTTSDVDGLVELFAADAVYHDNFYGEFKGHDAIRGMFETFFAAGKDFIWDWTRLVADDQSIAGEANFGFTTSEGGQSVRFPMVSIFEIANGKITAYREYFDFGRALLQMGVDQPAIGKIIGRRMERGL